MKKIQKGLKSAEMTTNKYLYGKVTETHHVQRDSESLEKKRRNKRQKIKQMEHSKKTEF